MTASEIRTRSLLRDDVPRVGPFEFLPITIRAVTILDDELAVFFDHLHELAAGPAFQRIDPHHDSTWLMRMIRFVMFLINGIGLLISESSPG